MLARPEVETKEHIVLWLSSKTGEYDWHNSKVCACAQYWAEHGRQGDWVLNRLAHARDTFEDLYDLRQPMAWLNWLACGYDTFEDLYEAARADLDRASAR
jgi:hypothetical protein